MVPKQSGEASRNRALRDIKLYRLIDYICNKAPPKLCAGPPAKLGARPERVRQPKTNAANTTPMKTKAIFHHPLLQTGPAEQKVMDNQSRDIEMAMSLLSTLGANRLVRTV